MQFKKILLTSVCALVYFHTYAQESGNASISGHVKSVHGEPIPGAIVMVKNTSNGTQSDATGHYIIENLEAGTHTIIFHAVGFLKDSITTTIKEGHPHVHNRKLAHDTTELTVVITGKSEQQTIKEQGFSVNVIDAKQYANTATDLNQVLNRTTGVRVREEGGLGSSFNFSLNGFSGSQVKFFIDGIPMTNFGASLGMNNMPINLAERMEVYKGVVPVWLGADALGGAVNIVTNQKTKNYLDVSYSYGSFNTHRASVNARVTDSSGITANANIFFNHSDNNYKINVKVAALVTGTFAPEAEYRHFHDQYQSATAMIEAGVTGKKYADRLLFGVIVSGNEKEIQQGSNMQKVAGEALSKNKTLIPTLKYQKDNFLVKKLNLNFYTSYNISEDQSIDTCSRRYSWTGEYTYPLYNKEKGELSDEKTFYVYQGRDLLTTTNLNYELRKNHFLDFNHTFSNYKREETDRVRPDRPGLSSPTLQKHSLGLGYRINAFDNKLSASLFAKCFIMNANMTNDEDSTIETHSQQPGYGFALGYFIIPSIQLYTSFEDTYRMPSSSEMLGNGLTILSNPNLNPEHSQNINIGIRANKKVTNSHTVGAEVGFIYRNANDFILSKPVGPGSRSENLARVRVTGFEGAIKYQFKEIVFFEINGTYQNIINTDKYYPQNTNIKNYLYLLRLPNIPYLFGNASLSFQFKNIASKHDNINLNFSSNYIEGFYLFWPSLGSPEYKREIPTQLTYNASLTYSMHKGKYNISFECRNLTDVKVYDYFYVQKPGRSFNVKFRYFFKK